MDRDDCLAEAALVFARCVDRYVNSPDSNRVVSNPAWLMSLFKRALANEFHTHAEITRRQREAEGGYAADQQASQRDVDYNQGTLAAALSGASEELRAVIRVVISAPAELLDLLLTTSDDATWARRINRLCGIQNTEAPVIAELRNLLTPE